mgnify:CR=1 FL=1
MKKEASVNPERRSGEVAVGPGSREKKLDVPAVDRTKVGVVLPQESPCDQTTHSPGLPRQALKIQDSSGNQMALKHLIHTFVANLRISLQQEGTLCHEAGRTGCNVPEKGKDLMPDPVANLHGFFVGGILIPGLGTVL